MATTSVGLVPQPLVRSNQWLLLVGVVVALALHLPLLLAALFLIELPGVLCGSRAHPVLRVARRLLSGRLRGAAQEDADAQRFSNAIAVACLGLATLAFELGHPIWGWAFSLIVLAAVVVALAGFCVGCYIYFQLRILRHRLSGRTA